MTQAGFGKRAGRAALSLATLLAAALLALALVGCTGQPPKSEAPPQNVVAYDPKLPLVLEYGRGSCPWCVKMKPILAELVAEYRGKLNVSEVSVEEQPALADRAGVRLLPTIIIYRPGGQEVFRHVGFWPKDEIVANLRELGLVS